MRGEQARVIGITGGIGTGKSRVARYLAQRCLVERVDLDNICRKLLAPGAAGLRAISNAFGAVFFTASGELDRVAFRRALFADDKLRTQVDALLHPLAREAMKQQIAGCQGMVFVEIPLLFEAKWQQDVDAVIVVAADTNEQVKRIIQRDKVTEKQALQSIASQLPLQDKIAMAHHVVDNSGAWQSTCHQLDQLAETLGCKD